MRAYFFSTCIGAGVFADTAINAIKLLQREGVEVIVKKEQTCCGQLSYNSGYNKETRQVALHNIDLFSKDYPVIVIGGSCAGVMKCDYLTLFEGTEDEEKVKEFSSRVVELSDFLYRDLKVKYTDTGAPVNVTWHSNCHALRYAKSTSSSKSLIKMLKNVTLKELEREEECCGFGGTFSVKEPEISNAMVTRKIEDIKNQGVDYVVTSDASCLLNISGALGKQRVNVKGVHLYDFLAERVGVL